MKKLSKETSYNLRTGFGTLVSNQSCIEAGKSLPWWIAIIIGLVGTFIPVIPTMVNIAKTNGDSFISGTYNYSFDTNASIATLQMYNDGIEFEADEEHYLTYYKNNEENVPVAQKPTEPVLLTSHVNSLSGQYDVLAYWLVDTQEKTVNDFYKQYINNKYISNSVTPGGENDPEGTTYYIPTILFYHKEGIAMYLPKANSTTTATSFSGDFINTPAGTKINERLLTVDGIEGIPANINDMSGNYIAGVYKNYKAFYNESYLATKNRSMIMSTFIYWGIYVGLTLFLGLLIFLLTRGKRNFNNYLKWYQCMSIAAWASFTPGVLGMILGFLMASYAIMFFILLMGVRIMWLSMKQLSPTYQAQ